MKPHGTGRAVPHAFSFDCLGCLAVGAGDESRVILLMVGVPARRITMPNSVLRWLCTACTPSAPPSAEP